MKLDISAESCISGVLIGFEPSVKCTIASVQHIASKEQGKGHAKLCISRIENIAKSHNCKEVWFPTVIHPALSHLLIKLGYKFTSFGPHPMMPDAGDVTGFKKEL